ncbi:dnaJ homolog subfamily C member 16-like isoform X2 [Pseudoliparis swirei]|uniref:dnaJ homolog subfamily C member 16-like isoform X2 n=1 Tax=Pseudoliparis swirei TaxID=2059687 RepID=UPI0024BD9E3B|nr:dnaJ homolog subfamily C member 16-like isoform X2 [Pseudoliparis swirei]
MPRGNCPLRLAIFLLAVSAQAAAAEYDPYRVLGVGRSASQAEVKRAYKTLAKEWHPDKNKDPKAEDMFIKVSKSYEILSNEERRSNFDRFGQLEENQPLGPSQQGSRGFHNSFYFDESFFHFPRSRDFADSKYLLQHAAFNSDVLPDSHRRPYLLKVTSEWCFACIHIEPVWKETVLQLEPLGVGIGIVDLGYERRLAHQLGAHRAPSIIGLVNGRVTFFHQAVVREHLRQFIEDLLPPRLVEKISENNYETFLNGWREENKPTVLLFDQENSAPLLYKLTAFSFRDYVRFGYVDQGDAHNAALLRRFNVDSYAPSMLLFKEAPLQPADAIQARGMKRQIMDEFVSNNKFLRVPRLVNQQLFDELCPVKQFHRRRKYCVLLITGDDPAFAPGNGAFLDFAAASRKDVLRFAYVFQRQQQPLCQALLPGGQAAPPPQVVILERRSHAGKVMYRPVSGGWNGSEEDKSRLHEQLELLQKDPTYLSSDATLPELNNERAPMFLLQWVNAAHDYIVQMYDDLLYSNCRAPKKDFVEVTELTDVTYVSNLVKLRPGHVNVVLLLSAAAKSALLRKYAKEVFSFSGTQTLHFSFLNGDKHPHWMPSLLRSTNDALPSEGQWDEEEGEEPPDYAGHVLALNGHRKYFCLFRPVFTGEDPDRPEASGPGDRRKSRSRSRSSSHSRSRSREDGPGPKRGRATSIEVHHKLDRLGLWMERLMEGTLPRLQVPAWPPLGEASSSSSWTPSHH